MNRPVKCALFTGALAAGWVLVCLAFPIKGIDLGTHVALGVLICVIGSSLYYLMEWPDG